MNEDEEADADDPASEVDTVRTRYKMRKNLKSIVITRKNNWLHLWNFYQGKFSGSLLDKILLAHSPSHAI